MQQQYQCFIYFANFLVVRVFHIYIMFLEYIIFGRESSSRLIIEPMVHLFAKGKDPEGS
jgi:uncharacterized membrane protein